MIEMTIVPAAATMGRFIGPSKTVKSMTAVVMMAVESARFLMIESQYLGRTRGSDEDQDTLAYQLGDSALGARCWRHGT